MRDRMHDDFALDRNDMTRSVRQNHRHVAGPMARRSISRRFWRHPAPHLLALYPWQQQPFRVTPTPEALDRCRRTVQRRPLQRQRFDLVFAYRFRGL